MLPISVAARCQVGVDETSFHERDGPISVLHVADGRGNESLEEFYKTTMSS